MIRRFIPLILVALAFFAYESGRRARTSLPFEERPSKDPLSAQSAPTPGPNAPAVVASVAPAKGGAISRGKSFFVEMQRMGLSPVDIHDVVETSKSLFNFRKVRPGQAYALYLSPAGGLDSLHFAIDTGRVLKVNRSGDGFIARQDTVAHTTEHHVTGGEITHSIYATLQEQKANPELASHLAAVFQWDIDFFTDIHEGDSFSILYENKVYEDGRTELGDVLAARVFSQGKQHYAVAYRDAPGRTGYYDLRGNSLQKSLLRAPLKYSRISSNFTTRRLHPVTHTYKPHLGVDYVAPRGTPVRSTGDGTVVDAFYHNANGKFVKIRHNSRYTTYYLHLSGFAAGVRRGARVHQGQIIGYVGSTGLATGSHLCYRMNVEGRFVNPRTVKLPSESPVATAELALFEATRDACLVRLSESTDARRTLVVEEPRSPLQSRMETAF
jgi:murein DD-endopeptidase MepM/ murein hydrolase activator NlpD